MLKHKLTTTFRLLALTAAFAAASTLAARAQTASQAAPPATASKNPAPAAAAANSAKPAAASVTASNTPATPANPSATPGSAASASALSIPPAGQPTSAEVASITPTGVYKGGELMPGVKKGSIQDVNAVGTRDIGGRGLGNWYSTESAIKIGAAYAAQIEKSSHIITDPVVAEYINRIGQNIVKNSDCKVPFTIKVIDSDQINAFALPGGFFFVYSGLILAADDEAELAAVMAHETAHVCAHHAMREMTRMHYAQIASLAPMILMGGMAGYGAYELSNIAIPITFLKFSRQFEAQADYLGIQYMYRAGYDPEAMISFFEKIEDLQKHKPGVVSKFFDTHPQTPDRIRASQEEIATILPPRAEYLEDTSEFEAVKARLARIESKRRLQFNKTNSNRPSLRRVNNNPNNPNNGEPPTLHRRDEPDSANTTN